jgi:predicted transcriptional regulator
VKKKLIVMKSNGESPLVARRSLPAAKKLGRARNRVRSKKRIKPGTRDENGIRYGSTKNKTRSPSRFNRPLVITGDPRDLGADDKRQAALEYRLMGHSEASIADIIGVTQGRVSQMLKEVLQEKTDAIMEMGEHLRTMELERIDRLILAWYIRAQKDERAASVLLSWIERRHKILPGLEISRSEMSGPGGAPIRLSASSLDITKLGNHEDGERLLANLEEIIMIAGPQVKLPENELPVIEHKRKIKNVN